MISLGAQSGGTLTVTQSVTFIKFYGLTQRVTNAAGPTDPRFELSAAVVCYRGRKSHVQWPVQTYTNLVR